MAILLKMPSLSPTMETGVIGSWNKKEGEFIEVGEVLAEVETDKAVMDYEMVDEGFVRKILVEAGVEVPVGTPIAILAETMEADISEVATQAATDEGAKSPSANGGQTEPPPAPATAPVAMEPAPAAMAAVEQVPAPPAAPPPPSPMPVLATPPSVAPTPGAANGGGIKISPYGRKLADEKGIDYRTLAGSGPGGRIVAGDIEAAVARGGAPAPTIGGTSQAATIPAQITPTPSSPTPATPRPAAPLPTAPPPGILFEEFPLSMMRKAIARKMEESKQTVPHFQATRKVRVEKLAAAREAINREFPGENKISVNDLIVKACAVALIQHPAVNSQYLGDRIRRFYTADISVAVGTDDGLITPVLRGVEHKGLREISAGIRELAARGREKKLTPEEYTGGTFTISNLGMYGITEFNGIINTPQACLLAVSGIVREPVVEGDAIVPGQTMNLTLSSDHRIVDGLAAAQFMDTLARILENPVAMVL